jgi:type IV pilus assembly protein PilY1
MTKRTLILLVLCLILPAAAAAGPDQFIGDAAIYSGTATGTARPNILLLIDNSNATLNAAHGTKYDPNTDYCELHMTDSPASCTYRRFSVYQAGQQGSFSTNSVVDNADANLSNIVCDANSNMIATTLRDKGTYAGAGSSSFPNLKKGTGRTGGDTAVCDSSGKGATYAVGNFLNYTLSPPFGGQSQREVVYDVIKTVVGGARFAANFGAMVYGHNNSGGKVVYQVGDLSSDSDFNTFLSLIPGVDGAGNLTGEQVLSSQTARPQAESLLDAGYYFRGEALPISAQAAMPSPVTLSCAKNHVIVITNGLSNKDDSPQLSTLVGDLDGDGAEAVGYGLGTHYLDDVAKHLYERLTKGGAPLVVATDTILAFQADDPLVKRAADANHGRGHYFTAADANQLASALTEAITNVMLESNSSFIAPVVPVSPENRTFSGRRVYMGFFKPMSASYWRGNVKKYGINDQNALTGQTGSLACYTDADGDGKDDLDGSTLPSGALNGSFRSSASSFWSSGEDAANLESGGAGEVLFNRNLATFPRRIYTYTGTSANLTDASNAFSTGNSALDPAALGVGDTAARDKLIDFVHGYDIYDENANGNTSEKRGASGSTPGWIFGDVLHSRPLVVNYASYVFTAANEADCSVNKSLIYVGGNDGMLHAIRDCNGSEAWSFLPPDLMASLEYMPLTSHTYFVDSTPIAYIYNQGNDGNIRTANGDKVILIFGERRGGGHDSAPTSGSYYALDVSNPEAPKFLWRISNQTAGFEELAESWSEPKLVKMRLGSGDGLQEKIVAFVGAGYDNIHEDTRFGNTDLFSDAAAVTSLDVGDGNTVSGGSTGASALTGAKGRGVYAIEIATLESGGLSLDHSGAKIWGYVYGTSTNESATPPASSTNPLLRFSIPSEVAAADLDRDGYADTLYVGDTGGRIWKFSVGDGDVTRWRGTRLFDLNSGTASVGKKFFYKPSVVAEPGYTMLFIGSGDREHPLNRDVNLIDRMYALKDLGQGTSDNLNESSLTDVTGDLIQSTTATTGAGSIAGIQSALNGSYGWYLSLDEAGGRKILSSPTVFNKIAYFTAFTPNSAAGDPCRPGNLGDSRLYAVDYKTAAAVMNYDKSNDTLVTTNALAKTLPGQVLIRSDRSTSLGAGIPSGMVILIAPSGDPQALIGVGGIIAGVKPRKGGSVIPLYWRQK